MLATGIFKIKLQVHLAVAEQMTILNIQRVKQARVQAT